MVAVLLLVLLVVVVSRVGYTNASKTGVTQSVWCVTAVVRE